MAKVAAGFYNDGQGRMRYFDGKSWTDQYDDTLEVPETGANSATTEVAETSAPVSDPNKPLYSFVSHIDGKNAKVFVWPDRVEWERKAVSGGKVAAGILTLGASTVFTGLRGKDTDMVPIKQITSVTSKKGVGFNTVVSLNTAGGRIEFRTGHKESEVARDLINRLILWDGGKNAHTAAEVQAPAPVIPVADPAAQLHQLKGLFDAGVLTQNEYDTKKTEILARL